jgi:hypothetical protein
MACRVSGSCAGERTRSSSPPIVSPSLENLLTHASLPLYPATATGFATQLDRTGQDRTGIAVRCRWVFASKLWCNRR